MTIVLKIGGARAVDPAGALADVAKLTAHGEDEEQRSSEDSSGHGPREDVVVVHGGSTAVDETLEELGEDPTYVETPDGVVGRFTDERTMEVFEMVLPGKLNTELVAGLQNEGVDAVGLSGVDGKLLAGPRKSAVRVLEDGKKKIKRGDHSGKIEQVNADLLETLLDGGYTPVATVPMAGKDGEIEPRSGSENASGDDEEPRAKWLPVNADADRAAAAIAGALDATLVVLTDVPGVLADPDDESTLIETAETPAEFAAIEDAAEGFMTKKVMAATEALEGGAERVIVADANVDEPVVSAVEGGGTHVLASALESGADSEDSEEAEVS